MTKPATRKPAKKYTILKGFCFENAKGQPEYIGRYLKDTNGHIFDELGQKIPNVTTLPKEALELAKKVGAI